MTKGISLHIGINKVDSQAYHPIRVPDLMACENDARAMQNIAKAIGYGTQIMIDGQATYNSVKSAIASISKRLEPGDIFLLTYSGHGSRSRDINGDESDGLDETWVLYDRQLVDDELYRLWAEFSAGVRIFMISDSCHSGTVAKSINSTKQEDREKTTVSVQASGILISACQDNQLAMDGVTYGLFTSRLLAVWDNGRFHGSYRQFRNAIAKMLPRRRSPNYFTFGKRSNKFFRQKPFTI